MQTKLDTGAKAADDFEQQRLDTIERDQRRAEERRLEAERVRNEELREAAAERARREAEAKARVDAKARKDAEWRQQVAAKTIQGQERIEANRKAVGPSAFKYTYARGWGGLLIFKMLKVLKGTSTFCANERSTLNPKP